jgi:hypothetical protein
MVSEGNDISGCEVGAGFGPILELSSLFYCKMGLLKA